LFSEDFPHFAFPPAVAEYGEFQFLHILVNPYYYLFVLTTTILRCEITSHFGFVLHLTADKSSYMHAKYLYVCLDGYLLLIF
jgi:hypothetical protein